MKSIKTLINLSNNINSPVVIAKNDFSTVKISNILLKKLKSQNFNECELIENLKNSLKDELDSSSFNSLSYIVLDVGDYFLFEFDLPVLESQIHNQRLETLGKLSGSIVHDFNNILATILGHVSYLQKVVDQSGQVGKSMSSIEQACLTASQLSKEILNFSKYKPQEEPKLIDVVNLVKKLSVLLEVEIKPKYTLDLSLPDEEIFVLANPGKLSQVIVNLVINAKDALEDSGGIKIDVSSTLNKYPNKINSLKVLKLSIIDSGSGISQDIIDKIFNPYFTTKDDLGTGLGLATVKQIVEGLGGLIELTSKEGVGTRFNIYIPIQESAKKESKTKTLNPLKGSETILLIDDEESLRLTLELSLKALGYNVELAKDGQDAIEKYNPQIHQLVVFDLLMPRLNGRKMYDKLCEAYKFKAIAMTGYADESDLSYLRSKGVSILDKPFLPDELAEKIRMILDND